MCLLVNPCTEVETAQEDLTFYKLAWYRYSANGKEYLTFFRNNYICLGTTYVEEDKPFKLYPSYTPDKRNEINEGAFHLFENAEDARRFIRFSTDVVLKAIVPKGTKFIRGTFRACKDYPSIATKSVRYETETVTF